MRNRISLMGAIGLLAASSTFGASLSNSSTEIPWIAYSTLNVFASAAFDENDLPIVLYNPRDQLLSSALFARFLLQREESVALLASELLDGGRITKAIIRRAGGRRSEISGGRYLLIAEEVVYSAVLLTSGAAKGLVPTSMLTCLAFIKVPESQRAALFREYKAMVSTGNSIAFGEARRTLEFSKFQAQMRLCEEWEDSRPKR